MSENISYFIFGKEKHSKYDHQPHKKDVWPKFVKAKWQNPNYVKKFGVSDVNDWNDIKDILKAMWQKYRNKKDHDLIESFLDKAAQIYHHYK